MTADGPGVEPGGPVTASPGTWRGLDALILENDHLRVTVIPSMGGHVAELVDRAVGRDLLWHNPRATPRSAPYGAYFDDWWSGGWDEIFPGGDRSTLHGEPLPYMGELWCVPWTATPSSRARRVRGRDHGDRVRHRRGGPVLAPAGDARRRARPVGELPHREPRRAAAAVHVGHPSGVRRWRRAPHRPAGQRGDGGGRVVGPVARRGRASATTGRCCRTRRPTKRSATSRSSAAARPRCSGDTGPPTSPTAGSR